MHWLGKLHRNHFLGSMGEYRLSKFHQASHSQACTDKFEEFGYILHLFHRHKHRHFHSKQLHFGILRKILNYFCKILKCKRRSLSQKPLS